MYKDCRKPFMYLLPPHTPYIIDIWNRNFMRHFKKDCSFMRPIMETAAKQVCDAIEGCTLAYVHDDYIRVLVSPSATPLFDGRVQQIVSAVSSVVTSVFNQVWIEAMTQSFNNDIDSKLFRAVFIVQVYAVTESCVKDCFADFVSEAMETWKQRKKNGDDMYEPFCVVKRDKPAIGIRDYEWVIEPEEKIRSL